MAHPLGAVVAVVEAEQTTPQRPTAVFKGAERLAEMVKVERQAEVAKVERLAEMAKVALRVQVVVVAVVAKIRNCLTFQILRLAMVTVSLIGAVLSQMAILVVSGLHQLLVQVELALKI